MYVFAEEKITEMWGQITRQKRSPIIIKNLSVKNSEIRLYSPEFSPIVMSNGQFDPTSVQSFYAEEKGVTSCSLIARNNLISLLGSMGRSPTLARGDADKLISDGRASGELVSMQKDEVLNSLIHRYTESMETVFDVYRYVSHRPTGLQSHRVVVFLWSDSQWYILDPIDGEKTITPQSLLRYIENDIKAEWLIRFPGYSLVNLVQTQELERSLPYFSSDLQLFYAILTKKATSLEVL